jgi:lysozyme family protein
MSNFDEAFNYTVANEGDTYTNDPNDKGGPTKFGITLATLSSYVGHQAIPRDVQNLTLDEAKEIYKRDYWLKMECDQIRDKGVAMALFDIGVNFGPSEGVRLIQMVVDTKADGRMGPDTLTAINGHKGSSIIKALICNIQLMYVTHVINDPSQLEFLKGWIVRSQKLMILMT